MFKNFPETQEVLAKIVWLNFYNIIAPVQTLKEIDCLHFNFSSPYSQFRSMKGYVYYPAKVFGFKKYSDTFSSKNGRTSSQILLKISLDYQNVSSHSLLVIAAYKKAKTKLSHHWLRLLLHTTTRRISPGS